MFCALCSAAFLLRDGDRRDLPSFPTRRSSDLRRPRTPAPPEFGPRRHQVGPNSGDRKSTRLNSSHVKISYAVFCLKKKKTNTVPRPSLTAMLRCTADDRAQTRARTRL